MAVSAQRIGSWKDNERVYLAVKVTETRVLPTGGTGQVDVEYIGSVPLYNPDGSARWDALSATEKRAALIAAVQAERQRSLNPLNTQQVAFTGTITLE